MKIFLSHTHSDKPVIEPIAIRLRAIFGQDNVFYDSWSIQPGEGIIARMSEGLEAPDYVFFFVSEKSLESKMVQIEWQNSLYSSSKGKTKLVPVRVDESSMPAVLRQNVWIDLYSNGIEAAIHQIVSLVQGLSTFTAQHEGFSNLTFTMEAKGDNLLLTISASHLMEPNPRFMILVSNTEDEIGYGLESDAPFLSGFNIAAGQMNGNPANGIVMAPMTGVITPKHPLTLKLTRKTEKPIYIGGVFHEAGRNEWAKVPPR